MNPFTAPRDFCCDTKYFPESPAAFFVTKSINATIASVTSVRCKLNENMLAITITSIMTQLRHIGRLWLNIWRNVSISFV